MQSGAKPEPSAQPVHADSVLASMLDHRIAEMRRMVAAMKPSSTASALRVLRDSFPDVPFRERVSALRNTAN
jgi:hypothetical protein